MSEDRFPADWLDLREPYDAAAVDPGLLDRLTAWRQPRGELRVIDLGAGTGSNLRRLAPRLGGGQRWTLVELDPALTAAGEARPPPAATVAAYRRLDLSRDLEALADERPDLVTASALIDLVSASWLARLADLTTSLGAALHIALTYDGRIAWDPEDPSDAGIRDLVNAHQRTDKGFGPALGPDAAPALARLLDGRDNVRLATSDWRLRGDDRAIQRELLAGYAKAAADLDPSAGSRLAAWHGRRLDLVEAGRSSLTVGHLDLLCLPRP